MQKCYAYRKPPIEEDLTSHSLAIAKTMTELDEYKAFLDVLEIKYDINRLRASALLHVAAALHDLGKIEEGYQSKCVVECTDFPGHGNAAARLLALAYTIAGGDIDLSTKPRDVLFTSLVIIPIDLHHRGKFHRNNFSPADHCRGVAQDLIEGEMDVLLYYEDRNIEMGRELGALSILMTMIDSNAKVEINLPPLNYEITSRPELTFIAGNAADLIKKANEAASRRKTI